MTIDVTDVNYEEIISNSENLVVLDFWAEWCGPCRMMSPIIDELAGLYEAKGVQVGKVDCDSNPTLCSKYGIRNIPTILFIKNGEVVDKQLGASSKKVVADKIESLL